MEPLSECAKAAFGEGTNQAHQWNEKHKQKLWDGKVDEIITELKKLSNRLGAPTKVDNELSPRRILDRNANSYFLNNKDAMNNPYFRAKGWPIGSGVVEAAVKQFALRVKGSDKFWNGLGDGDKMGVEEMLALSSLYHSEDGRWQEY